jgi:hypothetical protein
MKRLAKNLGDKPSIKQHEKLEEKVRLLSVKIEELEKRINVIENKE